MPWWPRSIKGQMLAGLLLLESLSIGLFAWVVTWQQVQEVHDRARRRAAYQAESLALEVREALIEKSPSWSALSVRMMEQAPTAATVKISDPQGNVLFNGPSHPSQRRLSAAELRQIPLIPRDRSLCFVLPDRGTECAHTVIVGNDLRGFTWIESDPAWDYEELNAVQQDTAIFAVIWLVASCLLVLIMARSIAQPLAVLHRGTKALMGSPEDTQGFPLPVSIHNEMGDLLEAFNRMVASLAEQRAGLNDTLSLLDSMLANAPIGLAFFDRNCRMMRVNQVFADMTGVRLPRHLGKTLPEVLSQPTAHELEEAVLRVFESNEPIRNLEFGGKSGNTGREWTWLVSAYPVRTTPPEVRWVGVIAMDASERKRSEDALRNSEKLAVTGRLAASIAHEINNPLEAVTNLVYLLRNFTALGATPLHYIEMLEYEVRRISEITQQTLRFYRQSTQPTRATLSEILDSVLSLYRGRFNAYEIRVERGYDPQTTLHCFAGEVRQVIANLVGNAIDACMTSGGRLIVRAWRSREWKNPDREGLRFVIADTGPGIPAPIRERIFEPFFTTKEATGTGLGLWISREIVSKHGGTMRLRTRTASPHSAETGTASGTVFQFFIPDDPEPLREAAAYRPTPARETTAD